MRMGWTQWFECGWAGPQWLEKGLHENGLDRNGWRRACMRMRWTQWLEKGLNEDGLDAMVGEGLA